MRLSTYLILVVSLLGCRSSSKIPDDFDYGKIENGIYTNAYFNMEMPVPATWSVQTREQMQQIVESGNKTIEKSNKELASRLKASEVGSATLFGAFKYKRDSVIGEFNSSLMILVENVRQIPSIKTGLDYLEQTSKLIKESNAGFTVSPDFNSKTIGGKVFDIMKVAKTMNGLDVNQLYYATIEKGFAFAIIASYGDDQQGEELADIIHRIKFK